MYRMYAAIYIYQDIGMTPTVGPQTPTEREDMPFCENKGKEKPLSRAADGMFCPVCTLLSFLSLSFCICDPVSVSPRSCHCVLPLFLSLSPSLCRLNAYMMCILLPLPPYYHVSSIRQHCNFFGWSTCWMMNLWQSSMISEFNFFKNRENKKFSGLRSHMYS